jgi:hypothetical protein
MGPRTCLVMETNRRVSAWIRTPVVQPMASRNQSTPLPYNMIDEGIDY